MARLGDICEILNGFAFKSEQYVDSGIRIIRIANVQKGYIEDSSPVFYSIESNEAHKYALLGDDLLISLTGNVGRVALLTSKFLPAALNQRVACLRIKDGIKLYKKYLYHFLNSDYFEEACIASSKGVAQKSMSTEWLKEYDVPLPPVEKQKQMVGVLDKLDNLLSLRKQQLAKLDELVKARFVEMFGDSVKNERSWQQVILGDLCDIGSSKRIFEKEYVNEGVPFYRTKEIVELSKGNKISTELFISESRFEEIKNSYGVPQKNDLLISAVGTIGTIWIVDGKQDFYFKDGNLLRIASSPRFDSVYMKYLLENLIDNYKQKMSAGTAYAALTIVALKSMLVYNVPLSLQKQFSDFAEQMNRQKLTIQQSLDKLEVLKKSLMQEYFG